MKTNQEFLRWLDTKHKGSADSAAEATGVTASLIRMIKTGQRRVTLDMGKAIHDDWPRVNVKKLLF